MLKWIDDPEAAPAFPHRVQKILLGEGSANIGKQMNPYHTGVSMQPGAVL